MNLRDALFNWLQMKIVSDHRPDDRAALDTLAFFETILKEDHQLESWNVREEADHYVVTVQGSDKHSEQKFDRELAEQLLRDIESNPKYNEQ